MATTYVVECAVSGVGEVEAGFCGAVEVVADLGQADTEVVVGELLGGHVLGEVVAVWVDDFEGVDAGAFAFEGGFEVLLVV
ncbi:hypothetical protein BW737_015265 [Actinomyces ruminis]|uniref:Uncharacterized protein n=1 Tax=Actinomyces ruminis TaxID=1937003 RepID=A0ABX4M916_9ACTO|nr:hypothetical protein [Actinomyces ruminis]PHP51308.1 hypothetical protein BW737_015265 [Actinomyces ruminis]